MSERVSDEVLKTCAEMTRFSLINQPILSGAIADMAKELIELRALCRAEPCAWMVTLADSQYVVDDIDDAQLVDDCTNAGATVTPLVPQPKEPSDG